MLSAPNCGWSRFEIGAFKRQCSYLTNPMLDLADLFTKAIKHESGVVHFDAEDEGTYDFIYNGEDFYIVSHAMDISVIDLYTVSLSDLIKEFIDDISNNIEAWADWYGYVDKEEMEKERPRNIQQVKDAILPLQQYLTNIAEGK